MSTNDPHYQPHPEELLEAYALDALEEAEILQVESHLEGCDRCSLVVAELHQAVSRLGQSMAPQHPSAALRFRLMDALETVNVQSGTTVRHGIWRAYRTPVARLLLPMAAAIMIALFSLGVIMNLNLSNRTQDLEQENATLSAQVAQSNEALTTQAALSTEQDSQLTETVEQLRVTNYWLANPENQQLVLKPPSGAGISRGTILVASDGRRALLLLADLRDSSSSSTYHVWLIRQGDKLWAGKVNVDDSGWGTATIQSNESLFGFDKVELTAERLPGVPAGDFDMVLEGKIPASKSSRMLIHQQIPWQ